MIPGPCLDAETVAAWADDALTADERAAVEAHAADCVRCQALLAAMVRTEPAPQPATAWWRRRSTVGWLVPLTAAAAATVWFVVSPGVNRRAPSVEPARVAEMAPTPSPSPVPQPTPQATFADSKLTARADNAETAGALSTTNALAPTRNAPLQKSEAAPPAARAAEAPAAPPPAAPAQPLASADRMVVSGALRAEIATNAKRRAEPVPDIVSSNPASRWRVMPTPGIVQHSADGGSTWELQQTNLAAELTSGASPLPSVCWLVGRGGVVLLSTDARTWRRVAFPESADLTAVTATDAATATVTTADGRKFSTADGGVTWDRVPLQGFPATPF